MVGYLGAGEWGGAPPGAEPSQSGSAADHLLAGEGRQDARPAGHADGKAQVPQQPSPCVSTACGKLLACWRPQCSVLHMACDVLDYVPPTVALIGSVTVIDMPAHVRSDDRYLLSYDEHPRSILGVLPISSHGQLRLTLRDDAAPADILQGIMHAACFRRLLLDARRRDSSSSVGGSETPLTRVRLGDLSSLTVPVSALLDSSRLTAREEAAQVIQHLPAQQWQLQPFLLSSSERGGYTLELD